MEQFVQNEVLLNINLLIFCVFVAELAVQKFQI